MISACEISSPACRNTAGSNKESRVPFKPLQTTRPSLFLKPLSPWRIQHSCKVARFPSGHGEGKLHHLGHSLLYSVALVHQMVHVLRFLVIHRMLPLLELGTSEKKSCYFLFKEPSPSSVLWAIDRIYHPLVGQCN